MSKQQQRPPRYPIRLDESAKRKLVILAADAGKKNEDFGGEILAAALDKLYIEYAKRLAKEIR